MSDARSERMERGSIVIAAALAALLGLAPWGAHARQEAVPVAAPADSAMPETPVPDDPRLLVLRAELALLEARVEVKRNEIALHEAEIRVAQGMSDLEAARVREAQLAALDRVVPLEVGAAIPLKDFLTEVQERTASDALPEGLPIFLDPIGLQKAGATLQSPVTLDMGGLPVREMLRHALAPIGLAGAHHPDNLYTITAAESLDPPISEGE